MLTGSRETRVSTHLVVRHPFRANNKKYGNVEAALVETACLPFCMMIISHYHFLVLVAAHGCKNCTCKFAYKPLHALCRSVARTYERVAVVTTTSVEETD